MFAKLQTVTVSFIMSVHLCDTAWLPLDGFSLILIFEDFLKIGGESSSLIKI
jgi:hypothetical protein